MSLIGYARVSTKGQNLERQIKELEAYGCDIIYTDKSTGRNFEREGFQKMKQKLRPNDVVVVHDLKRFGRNTKEIKKEWQAIRDEGADIVVRDMPILDTRQSVPGMGELISNLVLELLSWVTEEELRSAKEAQREGIAIAKEKGKYTGRKTKYHKDAKGADRLVYEEIIRLLQQNYSVMDIHIKTDVSRNTIYRIKNEFKGGDPDIV